MKNENPMNDLQTAYVAIQAACIWNLALIDNGYGCDQIDIFSGLVEEMAAIVEANPELDIDGVIEFYNDNN
jgi:hypothetical protein